jgi:DNA (cytosine-5)-methyltransferase 1
MTRIGSLFSGAGGLDLAAQNVFGGDIAWHCENDPAASKVIATRWPGVPNLGDITTTDWTHVAPVDIICAGWPCQPFSLAGQRKGAADQRALWPYLAGAVRMVRPRIVVLENVSAVLGPEFSRAANDLAALGYDIAWTCLRASDVGAPHRRERLFVLASDTSGHGCGRRAQRNREPLKTKPKQSHGENPVGRDLFGGTAPYPPRNGRHEGRPEPARQQRGSDAALSGAGPVELLPTPTSRDGKGANQRADETCLHGALLPTPRSTDRFGPGHHGDGGMDLRTTVIENASQWGKYASAIARWETLTRPAPPPTEPNTKGNPRLAAAFSEWMMGWPQGWVTDIGISRNDQLRIIGNGVCPQQAHAALTYLLTVCGVAA